MTFTTGGKLVATESTTAKPCSSPRPRSKAPMHLSIDKDGN
ncbi:hypothetical protein R5M74_09950 [Aeromonas hydrophila]|nr:hypothetical protein R5M74_09950 [Aeromonas hydrophila]